MSARTVVPWMKPAAAVRVSIPESEGMGKALSQGMETYSTLVPVPLTFFVDKIRSQIQNQGCSRCTHNDGLGSDRVTPSLVLRVVQYGRVGWERDDSSSGFRSHYCGEGRGVEPGPEVGVDEVHTGILDLHTQGNKQINHQYPYRGAVTARTLIMTSPEPCLGKGKSVFSITSMSPVLAYVIAFMVSGN